MFQDKTSSGRLVAAMLDLVSEGGWRAVRLEDVGERAGLDIAEVHELCADRAQLLDLFARKVDSASVRDIGPLPDGPEARYDRLLDILMQRFEVLDTYKHGVSELIRDVPREPETVLRILPQSRQSFAFLAREAGFPHHGLRGEAFVAALSAVWVATQQVWLRDTSPDLNETMAALDRNLRRAVNALRPALSDFGPVGGS